MTVSSNQYLPENQLIGRIQALERLAQQLRTAQVGGSDVLGPTVGSVTTTNTYNLTTTEGDVPDMSFNVTPIVASYIIVSAVWDFNANGAAVAPDAAAGKLLVDGVAQTDQAWFTMVASTSRATVGTVYGISLTATSHTIKMQAVNYTANRGRTDVNTSMMYWMFAT